MANTSQNIKNAIMTTEELKGNFNATVSDAKAGKLQIGAVIRLLVLALAWANQIAVMVGSYTVPNVDASVIYLVATVITIAATAYSYWQNNSWTANAKATDAIFDIMKNSGITLDEVCDAIGKVIDNSKKVEDRKPEDK